MTMIKGNTCKAKRTKGMAYSSKEYKVKACCCEARQNNSSNDNDVRVMHVWAEMPGESIISQGTRGQ
jgi:hypothetical protein